MNNSIQIGLLIIVSFTIYFVIGYLYKLQNSNNLEASLLVKNGLLLMNAKHFIGIILFGLVFYLLFPQFRFLILTLKIPNLTIVVSFFIILFISVYLAFKSAMKHINNSVQKYSLSSSHIWEYLIIRIVFLFSYEFFFRGILFMYLLEFTSLFMAILVATSFYVFIHIFDSKLEIIVTVPFGVILCLFTYYTNSIWFAFLIHTTISLVYEISIFSHLTLNNEKL